MEYWNAQSECSLPYYDYEWYVASWFNREGANKDFHRDGYTPATLYDDVMTTENVGLVISSANPFSICPDHSPDILDILDIAGVIPDDIDSVLCIDLRSSRKTEVLPQDFLDHSTVIYDGSGQLDAIVPFDTIEPVETDDYFVRNWRYTGELEEKNIEAISRAMISYMAFQATCFYNSINKGNIYGYALADRVSGSEVRRAIKAFSMGRMSLHKNDVRGCTGLWQSYYDGFMDILKEKVPDAYKKAWQVNDIVRLWDNVCHYLPQGRTPATERKHFRAAMEEAGFECYLDAYFNGVPLEDLIA